MDAAQLKRVKQLRSCLEPDTPPPAEPADPPAEAPRSNLSCAPTLPPSGRLRWIVPGYLGEGLTVLTGREKIGKSWLALDFAVAVASGGRALQSIACEQGFVVYVDYENGYRCRRASSSWRPAANTTRILASGATSPSCSGSTASFRMISRIGSRRGAAFAATSG